MKQFLLIIMVLLLIASSATAAEFIELQPGLYTIGEDIPTGKYDIRFNGLNEWVSITYRGEEIEGLETRTFKFTFSSEVNWWNPGGFLVTLFPGTLLVENSPIRLWIE